VNNPLSRRLTVHFTNDLPEIHTLFEPRLASRDVSNWLTFTRKAVKQTLWIIVRERTFTWNVVFMSKNVLTLLIK